MSGQCTEAGSGEGAHTCEVRWKSWSARLADMRLNWSSHVCSLLLAELRTHVREACTTNGGLDTRADVWEGRRNDMESLQKREVEQIDQTDVSNYLTEEKRKRLALADRAPFLAFRVTW